MPAPPDGDPPAPPSWASEATPGFPSDTFRANLYVHHPDGAVEWYALLPSSFAGGRSLELGRDGECAIRLDAPSVSERHARIEVRGESLWLVDLGSTNGTTIDGRAVRSGPLVHGVVLGLGQITVRFLYSFRESPVRLSLRFENGPEAGLDRVTEGPSTTIGRTDGEVRLDGPSVAGMHVRLDAYGPERIYLVPLGEASVKIDGASTRRITALEPGSRVTVGDHRFAVRAVAAPPAPPPGGLEAPPPRVDAAMLEARLKGDDPRAYDDRTIMDLSPLGAMVAKVLAGEVPPPPSAVRPPARSGPARHRSTVALNPDAEPETPVESRALDGLDRDEPASGGFTLKRSTGPLPDLNSRSTRSHWVPALLAIALLLGLGLIVQMPSSARFDSALVAPPPTTMTAPLRAQVIRVVAQPGQPLARGEKLVELVDMALLAELERVSTRIGQVIAAGRKATRSNRARARSDARRAQRALADVQRQVEAGQARVAAWLSARATAVEREAIAAALEGRASKAPTIDADATRTLAELVGRREPLMKRAQVAVQAPFNGALTRVAAGVRPQAVIEPGAPLLELAPREHLLIEVPSEVDAAWLTAEPRITVEAGEMRAEGRLAPGGAAGAAIRLIVPHRAPAFVPGATVQVEMEGPEISLMRWLVEQR